MFIKIVALLAFIQLYIKKVMRKLPANANLYVTVEFFYIVDKAGVGERDLDGNKVPIAKTFVLTKKQFRRKYIKKTTQNMYEKVCSPSLSVRLAHNMSFNGQSFVSFVNITHEIR